MLGVDFAIHRTIRNSILVILLICSIGAFPSTAVGSEKAISCDPYSALAHDYYQARARNGVGEIGKATLKVYSGASVLSRLSLLSRNGVLLKQPLEYSVQSGSFPPPFKNRFFNDKYVMILVPPEVSGQAFKQLKNIDDNSQLAEYFPSLLAVPRDAFFKGICHERNIPLLISVNESQLDQGVAHVLLPAEELQSLIAALFLDQSSSDIDALINYYGKGFVDKRTWGGWVALDVDHRFRTPLYWLVNSKLGLPVKLRGGIGQTQERYSIPSAITIGEELDTIADAWNKRLVAFSQSIDKTQQEIYKIQEILKQGGVGSVEYMELTKQVNQSLVMHRSMVESYKQGMEFQRGYFMTSTEIHFLAEAMNRHIDKLRIKFNELSQTYQDVVFQKDQTINESAFLSSPSVLVNGQYVEPLEMRERTIQLKELSGGFPFRYSIYLLPGKKPETFSVSVNGLIDFDLAVKPMSEAIRSKVYSEGSCSKQIDSVNTEITGYIQDNRYIKPVDVGVTFHVCSNFDYPSVCGKFPWYHPCMRQGNMTAKIGQTTARGEGYFSIARSGEDVLPSYGYSVCILGFFCDFVEKTLPPLSQLLRSNPQLEKLLDIQQVFIPRIGIKKGEQSGNSYMAIGAQTVNMSAIEALIVLEKLRGMNDEK